MFDCPWLLRRATGILPVKGTSVLARARAWPRWPWHIAGRFATFPEPIGNRPYNTPYYRSPVTTPVASAPAPPKSRALFPARLPSLVKEGWRVSAGVVGAMDKGKAHR